MHTINRTVTGLGVAILVSSSMALFGCSSSPNEAQLKQLNDLKDEVAALQKDLSAKESDKATLAKDVAEKSAKLKKCLDDQAVVKQRLANK